MQDGERECVVAHVVAVREGRSLGDEDFGRFLVTVAGTQVEGSGLVLVHGINGGISLKMDLKTLPEP